MEKIRNYSNFKRENKWLGIIDYKSLCILLVYIFIVIFFISKVV